MNRRGLEDLLQRVQRGDETVAGALAASSDWPFVGSGFADPDLRRELAEEAASTAELMGNAGERRYDVGVAGWPRLSANWERLAAAGVTVVNVDDGFGAGVAASRINRRRDG